MQRTQELFAGTPDEITDEERQLEAEIAKWRQIAWMSRWPKDRANAAGAIRNASRRLAVLNAARVASKNRAI